MLGERGGLDFGTGALTLRDRSQPRRTIHAGPQPDTRMALESFLTAVRSESPLPPPITLEDAKAATRISLLVRKAVDLKRVVSMSEITG